MNVCGVPIELLIASVMATTLRVATPLTLGALGGLFSERSGVVNIAIEGLMLMGAFSAYVAGAATGSIWIGLLAAIISSGLLAALHALISISFKVDQIISGTVVNILAFGMTGFFYDQYFSRNAPGAGSVPIISIPILEGIPVFGKLFQQQPVVWIALLLVAITHFVIFFTRWGLRTRAVGEHPRAADTVGVNVYFMRYANVIIGGAIAGLGGAYLIAEVSTFSPGMTIGRGFIALAAVIFGKWTPIGSWLGALLFGFATALQTQIQFLQSQLPHWLAWVGQIPNQFIGMLPYLLTIIVLAGFVGRARPPAASGKVYEKE